MMKYSRQDLPKIIVLSVILAGILIYIGVTYAKLSAEHRAQLEAEERAHAEAVAAAQAAAAAQASSGVPSPMVAALLNPTPPPQRDPFRPLVAAGGSAYRRTEETARSQATDTAPSELPPLPGPETTAGTSSNVLRVTGIVAGRPSVAVLRRGEDVFIVQPGDVLNGGLRVQAVSRTTVTLRDNQRSYVLRLGE